MPTFRQAVAFLESFIDYERNRGRMKYNTRALHLRRYERFLRSIGSPHRSFPVVHIAGTKGKGSTAALLHSILVEAGLRSGLYTSPHLGSYCERFQIDRRPISRHRFADAVNSLRRRLEKEGHRLETGYRTTFELLTAVAFEVFRDAGVQLGVIETGLGGRLDSTNVVLPELSIVTAIGLDHTHLLGSTHSAIAREKAGIAKKGRPLLLARQPAGVAAAVRRAVGDVCRRRGSPLHYAPNWAVVANRIVRPDGQIVHLRLQRAAGDLEIRLPLNGLHQAENLATAVAAVQLLRLGGWPIPDRAIVQGAAQVIWPGRAELLDRQPPLLLDGAHCPLSAQALVQTIQEHPDMGRPVFLFSLLDDKPADAILQPVARVFRGCPMVVFQAPSVRGCPVAELIEPVRRRGFIVHLAKSPYDALKKAAALADRHTLVVAFGSLYSVAPLRKAYQRLTRTTPAA